MSAQNLEVVRSINEAFNRRDIATMLERTHPDFEWHPAVTPGGLEGNVYRGHDGVRRWLSEVSEAWEAMEAFDLELTAIGDARVLALGRVRATGRTSGAAIERELAQVWELERGKARRAVGYPSHAEALRSAALEDQTISRGNVERVRRLYPEGPVDMVRLFEDRDRAKEVWAPRLHADFESSSDPHAPGLSGRQAAQTRVRGLDAFVSSWQDLISAFEALSMTPNDFIALPDNRVFVPTEFVARSKSGGVEMTFGGGIIWTLEDGLVRRLEAWFDRNRVLEAAGLKG